MKEAFDDLKMIFPELPADCDRALMATVRSVPVRERKMAFRPAFALALALMLALSCVAGAAFYPQMIGWFAGHYGERWAAWLEKGSVAAPEISTEAEGAVFTINEVLVRRRGLYVLGTIRPQEGYTIADFDMPEKPADGKTLRYVRCGMERIGVDGGALLAPGSWGYAAQKQEDGSVTFSIEVEDGMAVEAGAEYTLELYVCTYGTAADGAVDLESRDEAAWTFAVAPEKTN